MSEYPTYLIHYGTLGQKWGIRKYQNEDGTWTEEGLRRRRKENFKELKKSKDTYEAKKKASELAKGFSKEYEKAFNKKVKNNKTRFDIDNIGKKSLDDIKIDKEIESIIGKYANKPFKGDKDFTYGDLFKITETNRLYEESEKNFREDFMKNKLPKLEKSIKDADLLTEENYWNQRLKKNDKGEVIARANDEEIFKNDKRLNNAAITGLKALDGPEADISTSNKWWFVCEDQTIGCATIADLANRGYTEKQIKDLVQKSKDIYYNTDYDYQDKMPKGIFQLGDSSSRVSNDYIKDCVRIAKENTLSDAKQSRIKALVASGKSQEEVAKMLGVSTSTVNKYK